MPSNLPASASGFPNYHQNGGGRDLYVGHNSGGFTVSNLSRRSPFMPASQFQSSTTRFLATGHNAPRSRKETPSIGSHTSKERWSTTSRQNHKWPKETGKPGMIPASSRTQSAKQAVFSQHEIDGTGRFGLNATRTLAAEELGGQRLYTPRKDAYTEGVQIPGYAGFIPGQTTGDHHPTLARRTTTRRPRSQPQEQVLDDYNYEEATRIPGYAGHIRGKTSDERPGEYEAPPRSYSMDVTEQLSQTRMPGYAGHMAKKLNAPSRSRADPRMSQPVVRIIDHNRGDTDIPGYEGHIRGKQSEVLLPEGLNEEFDYRQGCAMPGYAGYIPGRSTEIVSESRTLTQDELTAYNARQHDFNEGRAIPGYAGYIPGKSLGNRGKPMFN